MSDPDPREKKITNADEQDVALNHSEKEHGFDEPAQDDSSKASDNAENKSKPEEGEEENEDQKSESFQN